MTDNLLTATERINARIIAQSAWKAIASNPSAIRENLLRSKSEQTFSGLLAQNLASDQDLNIGELSDPRSGTVLLEFKGTDYQKQVKRALKLSRNFHDLVVVNHDSQIEVIVENKYWYHFDGAKGSKAPKPEAGIREQLAGDIYKIRQSLSHQSTGARGFVLVNVVTPAQPESIPKSYHAEHKKHWKRVNQDLVQYRSEGLAGVLSVVSEFEKADLYPRFLQSSPLQLGEGFVDIVCAEVKL